VRYFISSSLCSQLIFPVLDRAIVKPESFTASESGVTFKSGNGRGSEAIGCWIDFGEPSVSGRYAVPIELSGDVPSGLVLIVRGGAESLPLPFPTWAIIAIVVAAIVFVVLCVAIGIFIGCMICKSKEERLKNGNAKDTEKGKVVEKPIKLVEESKPEDKTLDEPHDPPKERAPKMTMDPTTQDLTDNPAYGSPFRPAYVEQPNKKAKETKRKTAKPKSSDKSKVPPPGETPKEKKARKNKTTATSEDELKTAEAAGQYVSHVPRLDQNGVPILKGSRQNTTDESQDEEGPPIDDPRALRELAVLTPVQRSVEKVRSEHNTIDTGEHEPAIAIPQAAPRQEAIVIRAPRIQQPQHDTTVEEQDEITAASSSNKVQAPRPNNNSLVIRGAVFQRRPSTTEESQDN